MLEWYVAGFDYQQLMSQCEEMILDAAACLGFAAGLTCNNRQINLTPLGTNHGQGSLSNICTGDFGGSTAAGTV